MLDAILERRRNSSILFVAARAVSLRNYARVVASKILGDNRPTRLVHPDYIELNAADNPKVEVVREWLSKTESKPFEHRGMVLSLLSVDCLELAAANAILKTVEEPGKDITILLTCSNITRVIPTILSRVFRIYISSDVEETPETLDSGNKFLNLLKAKTPQAIEELLQLENVDVLLQDAMVVAKSSVELALLVEHFRMLNSFVNKDALLLSLRRELERC